MAFFAAVSTCKNVNNDNKILMAALLSLQPKNNAQIVFKVSSGTKGYTASNWQKVQNFIASMIGTKLYVMDLKDDDSVVEVNITDFRIVIGEIEFSTEEEYEKEEAEGEDIEYDDEDEIEFELMAIPELESSIDTIEDKVDFVNS